MVRIRGTNRQIGDTVKWRNGGGFRGHCLGGKSGPARGRVNRGGGGGAQECVSRFGGSGRGRCSAGGEGKI